MQLKETDSEEPVSLIEITPLKFKIILLIDQLRNSISYP